jgi:hypothetical protein
MQRTIKQNRSLHLYFTHLAESLNSAGLDMKRVLKPHIDIPWTAATVKEHLWRPIQTIQLQKSSTTDLSTGDVVEVFETLNRHLAERFGLHVDFPSIESLIINEEINEKRI